MPKIQAGKGGGRIIFDQDDWTEGLLPNFTASNLSNQKGVGLASTRSMNPFRQYGYALPGFNAADVTNVSEVSEFCRVGVVNSTNAYMVTNGNKLQKLALSTPPGTLTTTFHTIDHAHTGETGSDFVVYTAKVGGTSAVRGFYSFYDASDWDVGTFDFSATFDDDFMSTAPATPLAAPYLAGGATYPHPMIVGDDDILYIADRNFLHGYDGQNAADNDGKFFPAVLTLPGGMVISSFAKMPFGLMIFAYLSSAGSVSDVTLRNQSIAYLWDYNNLDITQSYDLNDNIVTVGFNYQGTIGCFTQGRPTDPGTTKLSSLRLFDGTRFKTLASFTNNPPIHGGVDVVGESIQWNSDGVHYSYGAPLFGVKAGLHKLSESLGSSSGMFKYFSTSAWISSGATTSGGLQNLSSDYYSQTSFSTGVAEPSFSTGTKGRIIHVAVEFAKTAADGRNVTVVLSDRGVASTTVLNAHEDVTGQDGMVIHKTTDASGNPFIVFDGLKMIATWAAGTAATDAPGISRVIVDYVEQSVSNS